MKQFWKENAELRARIAKKVSGPGHPMYGRKGKNNPNYGRKHTSETRANMSAAQKRRFEKSDHPMSGRKHTPEARARISAAHKRRLMENADGKE